MQALARLGRVKVRDSLHPERLSGGEAFLTVLGKVFPWCEQVLLNCAHRSNDCGSQQRCFPAAEGKPERSWGCAVTWAQVKWFVPRSFCISMC